MAELLPRQNSALLEVSKILQVWCALLWASNQCWLEEVLYNVYLFDNQATYFGYLMIFTYNEATSCTLYGASNIVDIKSNKVWTLIYTCWYIGSSGQLADGCQQANSQQEEQDQIFQTNQAATNHTRFSAIAISFFVYGSKISNLAIRRHQTWTAFSEQQSWKVKRHRQDSQLWSK